MAISAESHGQVVSTSRVVGKRKEPFAVLKGFAFLFKLLAWGSVIATAMYVTLVVGSGEDSAAGELLDATVPMAVAWGILAFISFGAISEVVRLGLQIEENTWRTAEAAERASR